MRLDKFLAQSSIGTRKAVRTYVKEGMVTVNKEIILDPAIEINEETDIIEYNLERVVSAGKIYYMFHKPAGCITARKDENKKTVLDYFDVPGKEGLFPVGRLDIDTEGLLFLTNDGEFNHQLMYPDMHVEKTYFFWAFGVLECEDIRRIETGICITQDEILTKPAKLQILKQGSYLELKEEIEFNEFKLKKKNLYQQSVVAGHLTISEGCKHQVKRMLKAVGCYVVYLKRVSIGGVELDQALQKGEYRELTEGELNNLLPNILP